MQPDTSPAPDWPPEVEESGTPIYDELAGRYFPPSGTHTVEDTCDTSP